ncbi:MAG: YbaN family protein [Amylibacter sp.]|nr:YbaN family protein [Amylibacter sp.]
MRIMWYISGWICVLLGTIGILLPLLPTVPFLLLAAFSFAKSSDTAHHWLINHRIFGPPIQDWQQSGAIRKPAKILSTLSILAVFIISLFLGIVWWALTLQAIVLVCVSIFIWSRPEA